MQLDFIFYISWVVIVSGILNLKVTGSELNSKLPLREMKPDKI